jgi:hypothetical protein
MKPSKPIDLFKLGLRRRRLRVWPWCFRLSAGQRPTAIAAMPVGDGRVAAHSARWNRPVQLIGLAFRVRNREPTVDFEAIRYRYDMSCARCRKLLAKRLTLSVVYDRRGRAIEYWGIGGDTAEELAAIYELTCPACAKVIELEALTDVDPYLTSAPDEESGPPVVKRR